MDGWGLNIREYVTYSKFTNKKHLVVEGKTDKSFFKILLDEFSQTKHKELLIKIDMIDIDDVDTFISNNSRYREYTAGANGNREKIQYIYNQVQSSQKSTDFVFFVDREFDEFVISLEKKIEDRLNKHKVNNTLIWSRGHSIENYLFDFAVLRRSFKALTHTELFNEIIDIFKNNFYSIICSASAVSLALKESKKLTRLRDTINWELIDVNVNTSNISLRTKDWEKRISSQVSPEEAEEIIGRYQEWCNKIKTDEVNLDVLRWLCDGKVGLRIIVGAYRSCICVINEEKKIKEPTRINKFKMDEIGEHFANHWADKAVRDICLYPVEVLEKLSI